jgi:hypothetical protein
MANALGVRKKKMKRKYTPKVTRNVPRARNTIPKTKKAVQRKVNSNAKAIDLMMMNQGIVNKLIMTKLQNRYYAYTNMNESFDTNSNAPGANQMINGTVANVLPMHLYSLTALENANNPNALCRLTLKTNCHDFETPTNHNYKYQAVSGFRAEPTDNDLESRFVLHRYSSIKLCLWGREAFKTNWNVKLIKILDPDLDPYDPNALTVPPGTDQAYSRESFYASLIKHQVLHPCATNKFHLGQYKGKFQIVWSKNYLLPERKSTEDQLPYRIVKLFRQHDKLLDYQSEARATNIPAGNLDNPNQTMDTNETVTALQLEPRQRQRLILMITANSTRSESEGGTSSEWASYDINISQKFSVLGHA